MLAIEPAATVSPSPFTAASDDATSLLLQVLDIYAARDVLQTLTDAGGLDWSVSRLNRIRQGKSALPALSSREVSSLQALLPSRPLHYDTPEFQFIDLFAGIGGIRRGFEQIGGQCVFTSEWTKEAVRTYKANLYSDPARHPFNSDIRLVTQPAALTDEQVMYQHIEQTIPVHQVLLAGFPF